MVFVFHQSPMRVQSSGLRNETSVVFISLREPDTPSTGDTPVWRDSIGNSQNPKRKEERPRPMLFRSGQIEHHRAL